MGTQAHPRLMEKALQVMAQVLEQGPAASRR
jgi:hypothetical protein